MTGSTLLFLACKSTVIFGLVAMITIVLGRRWPSACSIWKRVGIVSLLILPVTISLLPSIEIPIFPPAPSKNLPALSRPTEPSLPEVLTFHEEDIATTPSLLDAGRTPEEIARLSRLDGSHHEVLVVGHSIGSSFFMNLTVIYGAVVILLMIRLIGSIRSINRLRNAGSAVTDSEWLALIDKWTQSLQISRPVALRVSDAAPVPLTFGWRLPVILIPRHCLESLSPQQREAVVLHELTHIVNADFFWKILTQFMTAIYWAHPLAWLIRRDGEILRERLCDQLCVQQLGRQTYALTLIDVARFSTIDRPMGHNAGPGIAMAQRSSIRRRLDELDRIPPSAQPRSGSVSQCLVATTAAIALGLVVTGILTTRSPVITNAVPRVTKSADEDAELLADWDEFQRKGLTDPTLFQTENAVPKAPPVTWPDDTAEFNAQVAATVNGIPITNSKILDRYSGFLISVREQMLAKVNDSGIIQQKKPTIEDYQKFREQLIQKDIASHIQQVALIEYCKSDTTLEQIERMEAHVDSLFPAQVERLMRELMVETEQELKDALRVKGTTLAKIKENFRLERLSIECLVAKADPPVPISESEMRDYYESHVDEFEIPGVVWWREYRIARSPDVPDAEVRSVLTKLSLELKQSDTEDVRDIMNRYRKSARLVHSAYNKAEAGSPTEIQFGGKLFSLPLNQWSDVIERPESMSVIYILNRDNPERKSLPEIEDEIRQKFTVEQNKSRARKVIVSAMTSANIQSKYEFPDFSPLLK